MSAVLPTPAETDEALENFPVWKERPLLNPYRDEFDRRRRIERAAARAWAAREKEVSQA